MALEAFGLGEFNEVFLDGLTGGLVALGVTFAVLFAIGVYIYFSYAWFTIAQRRKCKYYKLAWVPFANLGLILHMGKFHWAWTFLLAIPILGWIAFAVLSIIATWRIFEGEGFNGWYALSMIIPEVGGILYLVAIGFVAWYEPSKKTSRSKKRRRK